VQTFTSSAPGTTWDYNCADSTFYAVGSMTFTMGATGLVSMTAATLAAFAALF
jgi:hypothetical protein